MRESQPELVATSVVKRRPVLWRVGGDFLALARVDGYSVTVRGPAAALWLELETPRPFESLVQAMVERFDADPDTVQHDLDTLVRALTAQEFLDVCS